MQPLSTANNRNNRALWAIAGSIWAVFFLSLLFMLFPALDRLAVDFFLDNNRQFIGNDYPVWKMIRKFGMTVPPVIAVTLIIAFGAAAYLKRHNGNITRYYARICVFLATSLALGPGLLVNTLLKDHWGRPRPAYSGAFDESRPYIPVWQISDLCSHNCSFVSGEAAASFWLIAPCLLIPAGIGRNIALFLALSFAAIISVGRMAYGAHFLSDVILSGALMLLVILLARYWLIERNGNKICLPRQSSGSQT